MDHKSKRLDFLLTRIRKKIDEKSPYKIIVYDDKNNIILECNSEEPSNIKYYIEIYKEIGLDDEYEETMLDRDCIITYLYINDTEENVSKYVNYLHKTMDKEDYDIISIHKYYEHDSRILFNPECKKKITDIRPYI
jgi:hypothetical protein